MSTTISRRSIARGAAWSVPVLATGVAAPALAASGTDLAAIQAQMLLDINTRRLSLGLAPLTMNMANQTIAQNWSDHLAATSTFVHDLPLPSGVSSENLSATCSSAPISQSPQATGDSLTTGWLNEKHSYAEWAALNATDPAAAADMYNGTGAYAADGESGHRINLENPNNTSVGFGATYSTTGSACGSPYSYGWYGVADFAS